MKIMLINLDQSTHRFKLMEKRLKALNLSFDRVSAVDGSKMDQDKLRVHTPNWKYPHRMTPGEIGCFLSHRKCWQQLIDSEEEFALIMEDDIVFHSKARDYLSNSDWIPKGISLIQFSFSKDKTFSDMSVTLSDGNQLIRVKSSSPCGAYAYIISREAARLALSESETIEGPTDNFLFGQYFDFPKQVPYWRLKRCVVQFLDDVPTTISGRGSENKSHSLCRMHPARLLAKFETGRKRTVLSEVKQEWFDTITPIIR